jgi:hypothetical protein
MRTVTGAIRYLGLAGLCIAVVACTTTGPSAVLVRPAASPALPMEGRGFRATLPPGWTAQPAQQSNGATSYQIGSADAVWLGEIAVLPIIGRAPPPGLTGDLLRQDIETLALQVTGTPRASTDVRIIEPVHLTNVAGETCAQLGVASTSHGLASNGLSVTCRHRGVIYGVLLESSTATAKALDAKAAVIAAGWVWS